MNDENYNNADSYPKLSRELWSLVRAQQNEDLPVLQLNSYGSACTVQGSNCGINKVCMGLPNTSLVCQCQIGYFEQNGKCTPSACFECKSTCIQSGAVEYCQNSGTLPCDSSICHTNPPGQCKFDNGQLLCPPDIKCENGFVGYSCSVPDVSNCTNCHPGQGVCINISNIIDCSADAACQDRWLDKSCQNCQIGLNYDNNSERCDGAYPPSVIPCLTMGQPCGQNAFCKFIGQELQCMCAENYYYFEDLQSCIASLCPVVDGSLCQGEACIYDANKSIGICNSSEPLPCTPPLCNTVIDGICQIVNESIVCDDQNYSCLFPFFGPGCSESDSDDDSIFIPCSSCYNDDGMCWQYQDQIMCSGVTKCLNGYDIMTQCRQCLNDLLLKDGICVQKEEAQNQKNKNIGLYVGIGIGILLLILLIILIAIIVVKKKQKKELEKKNPSLLNLQNNQTDAYTSDTNKSVSSKSPDVLADGENTISQKQQLPAMQKPMTANDLQSSSKRNPKIAQQLKLQPVADPQSVFVDGNNLGLSKQEAQKLEIGEDDQIFVAPVSQPVTRKIIKRVTKPKNVMEKQGTLTREPAEAPPQPVEFQTRSMDGTEYADIHVNDAAGSLAQRQQLVEDVERHEIKVLKSKPILGQAAPRKGLAPVKRSIKVIRKPMKPVGDDDMI